MSKDPRHALHELREYFEQKRNLAIRTAQQLGVTTPVLAMESDCYNHAMEMVAEYLREVEKR